MHTHFFMKISALILFFFFSQYAFSNELSISPYLFNFNYAEFDTQGVNLNSENGELIGLAINYQNLYKNYQFDLYGRYAQGNVDYDGQTQIGVPHQTTTKAKLSNAGIKYTYDDNYFFGISNWFWVRDIQPRLAVDGLYEEYNWWEFELGKRIHFSSETKIDLSLLNTFAGEIYIDLSDYGFGEPVLDLGEAWGWRFAINHPYQLSKEQKLLFKLAFENWGFERSNTEFVSNGSNIIGVTEPASESRHISFQLIFEYQ